MPRWACHGVSPQPLQGFDTADAGQLDVHQDERRLALVREAHALFAGLGLDGLILKSRCAAVLSTDPLVHPQPFRPPGTEAATALASPRRAARTILGEQAHVSASGRRASQGPRRDISPSLQDFRQSA
jgi:hypothetical protein